MGFSATTRRPLREMRGRSLRESKRISEVQAKQYYDEYSREIAEQNNRLIENWSKEDGLELGNGKLEAMGEKKAVALASMLEHTKRGLVNLREYQTSNFLGLTPQEVVKVTRYGYPNSVMFDLFDVWQMSSVKDTFFKLITKYGNTQRGATEGNPIYEKYTDGRFPSEIESEDVVVVANAVQSGTTTYQDIRPFMVNVFYNGELVARDDGAGNLTALSDKFVSGTIVYDTGAYELTFAKALSLDDSLVINYASSSEPLSYTRNGTAILDLQAYDFRAQFFSLNAMWNQITEEIMQSKLKMSARESLLMGIADLMKKSFDEMGIFYGKAASKWTASSEFNANWSVAGADSDYAHAQSLVGAIEQAKTKTYDALGREAPKTNILCGSAAAVYVQKHKLFAPDNSMPRIGVYKFGSLNGQDLYKAPNDIVDRDMMYMFGKGDDPMNVDSVVSIGSWKVGIESQELQYSTNGFKSEKGLGAMMDFQINEKRFATALKLTGLPA